MSTPGTSAISSAPIRRPTRRPTRCPTRCRATPSGDRRGAPRCHDAQVHHRVGDGGDGDEFARFDDRERGAAAHAGQRRGVGGPDHLGADQLYRRRGDHDAVDRLAGGTVRAQAADAVFDRGVYDRQRAVRHCDESGRAGRFPPSSGCVRGGAGADESGDPARYQQARGSRVGDVDLGAWARSWARSSARRSAAG